MKNFTLVTTLALMSVTAMANDINYVVTPSNADTIEAKMLKNFSITFPDAKSISIDDDFMSDTNTSFELTYDGISVYTAHAMDWGDPRLDKFEVDGNTLNITLSDPLKDCKESGEYHVLLTYVTVDDELINLDIPYQLNVHRLNPDEDYPLNVAKELDEDGVLWVSWDNEGLECNSITFSMALMYNEKGLPVGFAGDCVDETSQGRFGLKTFFNTEVSEDEPITTTLVRGLLELRDEYGTIVSTKEQEVTFTKKHTSGIHVIGEDEGTTISYDLNGYKQPSLKGLGIKNGKKVMMR